MTNLSRAAQLAADRFLSSGKKGSRGNLPLLLTIAQLDSFLRLERGLPRNRLEIPGLMFDRLLLAHSENYRKTRMLAARLGVQLVPRLIPTERKLLFFDPKTDEFSFNLLDLPLRAETWQEHRKYAASTYHDLNHAILFRLLRPKSSVWSDPRRALEYFSLVESLAVLRDDELSIEIGEGIVPLQLLGVLYSKPKEEKVVADFSWFRDQTLLNQSILLGMKEKRARALIGGSKVRVVSDKFVLVTHRRWVARYRRRFRKGPGLPAVPRGWKGRAFELEHCSPDALAASPAEMKRLYRWFRGLF